jgi:YidC/Oxa1 family membrane protein insertase
LEFLNGIREAIIWWGVPLMILAGIATHLTSRRSVARQREMNIDASANPQTAIMNKLMLYMFPLFVVVGGPFFPLAILFYWLANNSWTFGQLWIAHRMQDKRALAASQVVEEAKEAAKFSKPLPGAKPRTAAGRPVIEPSKITPSGNGSADAAPPGESGGGASGASGTAAAANGSGGAATSAKPSPGARPQRPPGQTGKKKKKTGRR